MGGSIFWPLISKLIPLGRITPEPASDSLAELSPGDQISISNSNIG
jgi:hypothetical protein